MRRYPDDAGFLFEAAQYHARKCEYAQAIECYEASYASEASCKPRYMDVLQGIAVIQVIQGEYGKAARTWERILENLEDEWGLTEEAALQDAIQERNRLLQRSSGLQEEP